MNLGYRFYFQLGDWGKSVGFRNTAPQKGFLCSRSKQRFQVRLISPLMSIAAKPLGYRERI